MKKLLQVLVLILCASFFCSSLFASGPKKVRQIHVIKITETGDVIIDAGSAESGDTGDNWVTDSIDSINENIVNQMIKPKMRFDVFKKGEKLKAFDDPNKILGEEEFIVARIIITRTTPTYSVGTIVSRMDGSMAKSSDISPGMICRRTTKQILKNEKRIYKNQKKAFKRQYKLMKLKAKSEVYKSLEKTVQDTNEISSIKAGGIKVEKK
jgi:hypothetical protein